MPTDAYDVRPYEPADREAILALYGDAAGERSGAWFDWRYVDNPFLPEVPAVVAEDDGRVVGARPGIPFPLRVGDDAVLALLWDDPLVAPDHRGQGLAARMVARCYERYAPREPAVALAFPEGRTRDLLEGLHADRQPDVGMAATAPAFSRVQNPGAVARAVTDGGAAPALGRLATPAVSGYLSLRDRLADGDGDLAVESVAGTTPAQLAALATERSPDAAHAHRSEAFYRWRFGAPHIDYRTYVAHGTWGPVAALVVGRRTGETPETVTVAEVAPLAGGEEWTGAVAALLDAAVADADDADVLTAAGSVLPRTLLESRGFRRTTALSPVGSRTPLLAHPLADRAVRNWIVGERRLSEQDAWQLSGCERALV